jgi:antitoxin VapB
MHLERHARLFRNGSNQALRIPREFELPADEVIIQKIGDDLIIKPIKKNHTLEALLASWSTLDIDWPQIDDVLPLDEEDIF